MPGNIFIPVDFPGPRCEDLERSGIRQSLGCRMLDQGVKDRVRWTGRGRAGEAAG